MNLKIFETTPGKKSSNPHKNEDLKRILILLKKNLANYALLITKFTNRKLQ